MFEITDYDRKLFKENPCDFIGINYYSTAAIKYDPNGGMDNLNYNFVPRKDRLGIIERDPEGLRNIIRKASLRHKGKNSDHCHRKRMRRRQRSSGRIR